MFVELNCCKSISDFNQNKLSRKQQLSFFCELFLPNHGSLVPFVTSIDQRINISSIQEYKFSILQCFSSSNFLCAYQSCLMERSSTPTSVAISRILVSG